jgi:YHS domain-containing protein
VIRFILIAILVLLVARMFWRVVDGIMEGAGGKPRRGRTRSPAVRLVRDPVCGTYVSPQNSFALAARDTTHYFCSEQCRTDYQRRT